MKKLAILGSTGSIGQSTLDVVRAHPDKLKVVGLAAGSNADRLREQAAAFGATITALASERGSEGFINLANLYHEYCQAPRNERSKVLDRVIRGSVGTTGFELWAIPRPPS